MDVATFNYQQLEEQPMANHIKSIQKALSDRGFLSKEHAAEDGGGRVGSWGANTQAAWNRFVCSPLVANDIGHGVAQSMCGHQPIQIVYPLDQYLGLRLTNGDQVEEVEVVEPEPEPAAPEPKVKKPKVPKSKKA